MRSSRLLKLILALGFFVSTQAALAGAQPDKKKHPVPRYQRIQDEREAAAKAAQNGAKVSTEQTVPANRPLETVQELTVMTYNVLNFKTSVGFQERQADGTFLRKSNPQNKSETQILGVVTAIKESNPDIAIFEEIEGVDTLAAFVHEYLNDQYSSHIVRGNDERGIEVGMIVKKNLPLAFTYESHRDITWQDPVMRQRAPLFSRDIPTLIIRRANQPTGPPVLIVLGNHAKSKRDRPGDGESNILRSAQYEALGKIIDGYLAVYGPEVPLLLAGDFNTDVQNDPEVKPVRDRLADVFDIAGLTGDARVTHSFHPQGGGAEYAQIDAIFVSKALESSVESAYVYRYKNADGTEKRLPRSYNERSENPSDHYPVVLKLKTSRIFPEAFGL